MKVVLFCGGLGMRMREFSENTPKALVPIGYRPIIWHIMKYYSYFGHKDFVLCLGYRGDLIKEYFLNYNEAISNDFVLQRDKDGKRKVQLIQNESEDWTITFAETGLSSNIGTRLFNAKKYLEGEEMFLAHYTDILTDLHLNAYIDDFKKTNAIASFVAAKPPVSFHTVEFGQGGHVRELSEASGGDLWQNGGFFALRHEIFDYLEYGEELVIEPFAKLITKNQLVAHKHHGFWSSMDTFKEMQSLNQVYTSGEAPWEVWKRPPFPFKAEK